MLRLPHRYMCLCPRLGHHLWVRLDHILHLWRWGLSLAQVKRNVSGHCPARCRSRRCHSCR